MYFCIFCARISTQVLGEFKYFLSLHWKSSQELALMGCWGSEAWVCTLILPLFAGSYGQCWWSTRQSQAHGHEVAAKYFNAIFSHPQKYSSRVWMSTSELWQPFVSQIGYFTLAVLASVNSNQNPRYYDFQVSWSQLKKRIVRTSWAL